MRISHDTTRSTAVLKPLAALWLLALTACAEGPDSGTFGLGPTNSNPYPGGGRNEAGVDGASAPYTGGKVSTSMQQSDGRATLGDGGMTALDAGNGTTQTEKDAGAGPNPTGANPQQAATCPAPNWTGVQAQVTQTGSENLRSLRATVQGECLNVLIEFTRLDTNYALLLDTDGLDTTGYKAWNWTEHSGADYMIQAGLLQRHDSTDAARGWKWRDAKPLQPIPTDRTLEFRIPLRSFQSGASVPPAWLGFMAIDAAGNASAKIPSGASFVQLSSKLGALPAAPDRSLCRAPATASSSSTRTKIGVSRGMIVPAYLPVEGSDAMLEWQRLINQAPAMSISDLDYWVVANGPNNGPLTSTSSWQKAKDIWDELRFLGGRVFGYVHTCKRPSESAELIDLEQVMSQIDSWVKNYPALDGIWLDEFNPRYELFALEGSGAQPAPLPHCDQKLMPPSYPNGACAGPIDRSFIRADGCYDPNVQIQPAGGYYHSLVARIRAAYPWLRIVGNAGGKLYSNQLKYADLVDVLVAHESSFSAVQGKWSILDRQPGDTSAHVAALLHGAGASSMQTVFERVLAARYSHVYVTDQSASGGGNVWGRLASYFEAEVDYITTH